MKSAKKRILGLTTASLAAAIVAGSADTAAALNLPIFDGGNILTGTPPKGLDENYIGVGAPGGPGDYLAPNVVAVGPGASAAANGSATALVAIVAPNGT